MDKVNLHTLADPSTLLFLLVTMVVTMILCSVIGLCYRFMHRSIGSVTVQPVINLVSHYDWTEMDWAEGQLFIRILESSKLFKGRSNSANRRLLLDKVLSNCSPLQVEDEASKIGRFSCFFKNKYK